MPTAVNITGSFGSGVKRSWKRAQAKLKNQTAADVRLLVRSRRSSCGKLERDPDADILGGVDTRLRAADSQLHPNRVGV